MLTLLRRSREVETPPAPLIAPEESLERGVGEAAAVLDEHYPDWYKRITHPLNMDDVELCVLGQAFEAGAGWASGYSYGLYLLKERGFVPRPRVFWSDEAKPYWDKEIERRKR